MTDVAPRKVTPPPLQAPTAREKKYDRQLRLWAASGQRALEESHVLLIIGDEGHGSNSSVAGAETLKNLILPSVGSFTIADSAKVTEQDLGVNFFLESDSLNKSRGDEMRRLLQELNTDVTGHAVTSPLAKWLSAEGSLKPYNLILLCAPVAQDSLQKLCSYASASSIPIICIQSVGFFASFSAQIPSEFPIVDTHPDAESTQDLRLLAPWPELVAALDSLGDIPSLPDHQHGHIPYILLLLHYLRHWRITHDDKHPSTYKEKIEFRDLVRSGARTNNPERGEENFDEACAAVLKTIAPPPLGSGCKEMLSMSSCNDATMASANFWIIANAIKQFYDKHGVLPLPGTLPDMKATSADYVKLQTIYKSKARADVAEVTEIVRKTELSRSEKDGLITDSEIESFCKNASYVRVLANPNNDPLPTLRLMTADTKKLTRLKRAIDQDWESMIPVFIALNADNFPPGQLQELTSLATDMNYQDNITKAIEEVSRAQGGELHNVSSVLGGMVAQEAIKLLTRQYVPVDGICVFDGIRSKSAVFKF